MEELKTAGIIDESGALLEPAPEPEKAPSMKLEKGDKLVLAEKKV